MSEQKYNLLDCNTSFQVIWYCVGNWTNKLIATYQRRVGTLDLPSIYQLAQKLIMIGKRVVPTTNLCYNLFERDHRKDN